MLAVLTACSRLVAVAQQNVGVSLSFCNKAHNKVNLILEPRPEPGLYALAALEVGDMAEFNQCQSMLKQLYAELPLEGDTMVTAAAEFAAYRVLYALTHSAQQLGEELRALAHSRHGWLQHRFVRHALEVPAPSLSEDVVSPTDLSPDPGHVAQSA